MTDDKSNDDFPPAALKLIAERLNGPDPSEEEVEKILLKYLLEPPSLERRIWLRTYCGFFFVNADLMPLVPLPLVYEIMKAYWYETRMLKHTPKTIAGFVDWRVEATGKLTEARREIAQLMGSTEDAVKQAHLRHGRNVRARRPAKRKVTKRGGFVS